MNASTSVATREPKAQLVTGGDVAAIIPRNIEETVRLSQALALSGMAPSSLKTAEQIMVAIMAGAELGLPPFQSLQSFAVINGRPTIWGDGLVAVARAGGAKIKEWLEGEAEAMVAFCEVTRADGETIQRDFSVADAKKANLWAKQGPWQQYPKRMLAMRARAFALRDGCADMLRGMQVREEVEDYNLGTGRDVTPTKAGIMARLPGAANASGISAKAVEEGIATEAPVAPEVVDEVIDAAYEAAPEVETPAEDKDQSLSSTRAAPSEAESQQLGAEGGTAEEIDPVEWAAWANVEVEGFESVAELDAFSKDPNTTDEFERLVRHSPGLARSLEAALKGRRKAMFDREQAKAASKA